MKIRKIISTFIFAIFFLISIISLASAITVESVSVPAISPGQSGRIDIELENTLNDDVQELSLRLNLASLPFTPVGSSEESVDELEEGEDEEFTFTIKSANDITPGDYQIPYVITFKLNDEIQTRQGTIGVTVKADADLDFTLSTTNPVIGQQGQITLRVINKGFADAKFLTLQLIQDQGYTLLSESNVYIGTVDSDDFETASFDVIFKQKSPVVNIIVKYKDFDNTDVTQTISLPIKVYTEEEALQLGLVEKSNLPFIIGVVVTLIVIFILYRTIRKALRQSRRKNSMNGG